MENRRFKLVVISGSGISAESGIATFRGSNGLWSNYRIEDVCTADAWRKNPELVSKFYNERYAEAKSKNPNSAHRVLAELEQYMDVEIITQNVDDLHERAGSSKVLHLHGELSKLRSNSDDNIIVDRKSLTNECPTYQEIGPGGLNLRPHIVFFGEAVPNIEPATEIVSNADIVLVVGTSMVVYPAAGLINYAKPNAKLYMVDPNPSSSVNNLKIRIIAKPATEGLEIFKKEVLTLI